MNKLFLISLTLIVVSTCRCGKIPNVEISIQLPSPTPSPLVCSTFPCDEKNKQEAQNE